jgi:hypothetical protein
MRLLPTTEAREALLFPHEREETPVKSLSYSFSLIKFITASRQGWFDCINL